VKTFLIITFLIVLGCLVPDVGRAKILFQVGFDQQDLGSYTSDEIHREWDNVLWANKGVKLGRVAIQKGGAEGTARALKVIYPKNQIGSQNSGASWRVRLGEYDELYSSYWMYFPENFDAVRGGKLPGLCGASCPTGGDDADGTTGFSARYMFLKWPNIVLYFYHMHKQGTYGDNIQLNYKLVRNEWINLTQRVKLNQIGKKNGEVQIWIDNKEVLFLKNLELRTKSSVKIDLFEFSTFYGGNTDSWAPKSEQHIYFDQFMIYTSSSDRGPRPADLVAVPPRLLRIEAMHP